MDKHDEAEKRYPFMMDVLCSFCEMEVVTKHAWDEKTKPTEQMCAYCQREIQT